MVSNTLRSIAPNYILLSVKVPSRFVECLFFNQCEISLATVLVLVLPAELNFKFEFMMYDVQTKVSKVKQ